jgi:hypothetical protein
MALPASLVALDKQLLDGVANLAADTVTRVLPDLSTVGQQEAGAVMRQVAGSTMLSFGNLATQTAVKSYDSMTLAAIDEALAILDPKSPEGQVARIARGLKWAEENAYKATTLKAAPVVSKQIDSVVGNAMSKLMQLRFADAETALSEGVSRMVANFYRDTMATNSYKDKNATGYQRVASPNACAFCLVVALNKYTTFEQSGGYHDSCRCTTIPIYRNLGSFQPDYYEQFQQEYVRGGIDAQSSKTTDILAAIRLATGRN